jgi:CrcB protein
MSPAGWVGVAMLGGFGAIGRFLLDGMIGSRLGRDFPLGTLIVNVSGAFLLGLATGLLFSGESLELAGTATVGSYTTFSTWMLETHRLREDGEFARAFANAALSLVAGFGAVALGRFLGSHA